MTATPTATATPTSAQTQAVTSGYSGPLPAHVVTRLNLVGQALARNPAYAQYAGAFTIQHLQSISIQVGPISGTPGIVAGSSPAITWGQTIHTRASDYNPTTVQGLALLAEEVVHTQQYQQAGNDWGFRASYAAEYAVALAQTLNTDKAHGGVSYEIQAIAVREQFKTLEGLRQNDPIAFQRWLNAATAGP